MIDLNRIVGFGWDAGNARKNEKHGVSQSEAEQVFFDTQLLVAADLDHSEKEARHHAFGSSIDGRRLHVVFTLRAGGNLIRVISARDMDKKERQIYERKD